MIDVTEDYDLLEIVGEKTIISPAKEKHERITINTKEYSNCMMKVLPGLYRQGVNEIEINIHDNKILEDVTKTINELLIGFEIIAIVTVPHLALAAMMFSSTGRMATGLLPADLPRVR